MEKYDFILQDKKLQNLFNISKLTIDEIGDGNMNYVYKLDGDEKTYALKHAKSYLKMLGKNFILTQKRVIAEMNSMEYFHSISPHCVPQVFHKNEDEYFFVMKYLDNYSSLRQNWTNTTAYEKLGDFLYTLSSNKPKKNLYYECEDLKEITKNYVFEYPFIQNHEALVILDFFPWREFSAYFLANKERLKEIFLHSKTSLIHGDLHTDSVMLKEDNIAIIDSEFSLFCEVSFDIGNLLAHIILAQIAHKNTPYEEKISLLLRNFENDSNLLQNAIGFCSVEMARRLFVPAKSKDLESAMNKKEAYELSFNLADRLGSSNITNTKDLLKTLKAYF